uniref:SAM domain-containing protein n=1 Tax=Macrostomum lignano TaxID=282301 RepID=A0A1I8IY34_9PLAT
MQDRSSFTQWSGPTSPARAVVGMPDWYVAACRANVKSALLWLVYPTRTFRSKLGISNPLHRLKLRLACRRCWIGQPGRGAAGNPSLVCGRMDTNWVGNSWLPSLGLGQYRSAFMDCLVDARMLPSLGKKGAPIYLRMSDSGHRRSLVCGIRALHLLGFDRQTLEARREGLAPRLNSDLLVWSNDRLQQWLRGLVLLRTTPRQNRSSGVRLPRRRCCPGVGQPGQPRVKLWQQLSGGSSLVGSRAELCWTSGSAS